MDYQNISLAATQKTNRFSIVGDGFWYIDAAAADGVDTRIKVTPEGGSTVVLKPGQHFRLEAPCASWVIASMTGAEVFTGNIIIGKGDFGDSNINNKFVLDASFANEVTVVNTAGSPVPVSLAGGELEVKNDAGNPLNTIDLMKYTSSFSSAATSQGPIQVVSAAANVNGCDVWKFSTSGALGGTSDMVLLAKATAPTGYLDGDLISVVQITASQAIKSDKPALRVPAGKGLWIYCAGDSTGNQVTKNVLYTLL